MSIRKLSIFISFLFFCISCSAQNNQYEHRRTIISVRLKQHTQFRLNYLSKLPPNHIHFENKFMADTTITLQIMLTKPTEFLYAFDPPVGNTLLALPGDSIIFDENKQIIYSSSYTKYLNDYIDIPKYSNYFNSPNITNSPFIKGFKNLLAVTEEIYNKNSVKINALTISSHLKEYLNLVNLYEKYFQIFSLTDINKISNKELRVLDSLGIAAISGKDIFRISSAKVTLLMSGIAEASLRANGIIVKNNFWTYFTKVDKELNDFYFYKEFLYEAIANIFLNNFHSKSSDPNQSSLGKVHTLLLKNEDKSAIKDSLIKFGSILLGTETNFAKAKAEINNFYGGRFSYLFKNEAIANHEPKNTKELSEEMLENTSGKAFRLNDILIDEKYKLIVVDFWASWCAPCIREFPKLKKIESEMKNLPIKFVGISTDETSTANDWVEKTKQLFSNDLKHQFRLKNDSTFALQKLLQVTSIPRYVVLDNKGNVIDLDLERPSAGKFKAQLLQYLKKYATTKP